jgi:hypothetical protein
MPHAESKVKRSMQLWAQMCRNAIPCHKRIEYITDIDRCDEFWDTESSAGRYFLVTATNLDPRLIALKCIHPSGIEYRFESLKASFEAPAGPVLMLLFTDIFISEKMIKEQLLDMGARDITIEMPGHDVAWHVRAEARVWDAATRHGCSYFSAGGPGRGATEREWLSQYKEFFQTLDPETILRYGDVFKLIRAYNATPSHPRGRAPRRAPRPPPRVKHPYKRGQPGVMGKIPPVYLCR